MLINICIWERFGIEIAYVNNGNSTYQQLYPRWIKMVKKFNPHYPLNYYYYYFYINIILVKEDNKR